MYTIQFYTKENGNCPFADFLKTLQPKLEAKTVSMLQILMEKGNELREPYTKYLEDGLFELRVKQGNNITRAIFFFYVNNTIIVTNGFVKKQQKTPKKEIEKAKKFKADFYLKEGK